MKKFRFQKIRFPALLLALCLCMALLPISSLAVDDPVVSAKSAIVMDADSGEVYFEKNADDRVEPASTTKMVTALLVVEAVERGDIQMSDEVTASDNCQYNLESDSSNADPIIEPGEVMTVQDLLYCTILVSANEACNILAEYVSGSVDNFVAAMNQRAAELGCTGTHFANANGLQNENHYTTARDFALIAQEILNHTQLVEICSTLSHTVEATNVNEARLLTNTNSLLNPSTEYYYENAYGIKTGYFEDAGYCLVSAADYNNINVVCVVMGSPEAGGHFSDTITLLQWMFDNYSYHSILSSTETLYTVPVTMGVTDSTGVRADNDISVILPNDEEASVYYQITLYNEVENEDLVAPVNAGDVLGEIKAVELDDDGNITREFGSAYLVATTSVDMSRADYLRTEVKDVFQTPAVRRIITILIVLLALYLVLVVFYRIQRRRHLHSLRAARKDRAMREAQQEAGYLNIPQDPRVNDSDIDYFDNNGDPQQLSDGDSKSASAGRSAAELDDYFDSFFRD